MRKKYALEKGAEKRLELSWKGKWKHTTVTFDSQEIGTIQGKTELTEGREFELPDGSRLKVVLKKVGFVPILCLYRDDKPLPGTDADPNKRLRTAYTTIFVLAGISLFFGAMIEIAQIRALQKEDIGIGLIFVGAIYVVLGVLVRKRSTPALAIAVILLLTDLVLSGYMMGQTSNGMIGLGFMIKIAMLFWMSAGFGAIRELKAEGN